MNARAASVLRGSVGAGNPHHNITHHCITHRINGGAPWEKYLLVPCLTNGGPII